MASIFVNVASYNDPDLPYTIESAIRASSGAHIIHLGICEQVTEYALAWSIGHGPLPLHCEMSFVFYDEELLGVGGARAAAEGLYDGENYILQIDAHTRFDPNWDDILITASSNLPTTAGIISGAMPSDPWLGRTEGRNGISVIGCEEMDGDGFPRRKPRMIERPKTKHQYYPARLITASCIFGPAWVNSVPYDPHIMFYGEEPTFEVRLWTSGVDLYHADIPFMHGNFRSPNRPWTRPGWIEKNKVSLRRCRALLGIEEIPADDPALVDIDAYGFGDVRSFGDWQEYSGFNYEAGTLDADWGDWPD